jgi:hypothetical protein
MTANVARHFEQFNSAWRDIGVDLLRNGFALFTGSLFEGDGRDLFAAREAFIASCRDLPCDPYSAASGRNRRYGRFVLDPWSGGLDAVPPVWDGDRNDYVAHYRQLGSFNPEHSGGLRAFAPLTDVQTRNRFLHSLITRSFFAIPPRWERPVVVGIHILQYAPEGNQCVASSPASFHCDGEPFTWSFLIERTNVAGGENIFATLDAVGKGLAELSPNDIRARVTLETPMDGWVVDDFRVSHFVSPFKAAEGAASGKRTLLIIDFTPAAPGFDPRN